MMQIVNHPLMQRLTRIKQLGMTGVVFPGAQHTRFQHSLGAFHLMSEALLALEQKGVFIFDSEKEAVGAAILMHDIGHGPFSHVLEHTLISGISHEEISLLMMESINRDLGGELSLAIKIFKGDYPKSFLHQLISSQLDMDRLDYLRRDSFYTGVGEGNIGSARIIKMLEVVDGELVVDSKGIYSIENYLTSRRLMYWQVYLHKTTVAAEKILINALTRAKELVRSGHRVFGTPALMYFLTNDVDADWFASHPETLDMYSSLDDNDIWSALKVWMSGEDRILARLASDLVTRHIFHVEVSDEPIPTDRINGIRRNIAEAVGVTETEAEKYFMSCNSAQKDMYDFSDQHIDILMKDGTLKDISEASDMLNIGLLSTKNRKYYLCYLRY